MADVRRSVYECFAARLPHATLVSRVTLGAA
jgi:hypothetical protein